MIDVEPAELEGMLSRGWRRFGAVYVRPLCNPCMGCVTLRVPAATFAASASQKRAAKKAATLRREWAAPRVDAERLRLYAAWHAQREVARGWDPSTLDRQRYAQDFAFPHPSAREVAFYDDAAGGRLVALGIVDETPNALSAVYFFYDPARARDSLGVANVVLLIEDARRLGLAHVYLGYCVQGCASLEYKDRFRPHEALVGRPAPNVEPSWVPSGSRAT